MFFLLLSIVVRREALLGQVQNKSILYSRVGIITLAYFIFLWSDSLYIEVLGSGFGLFGYITYFLLGGFSILSFFKRIIINKIKGYLVDFIVLHLENVINLKTILNLIQRLNCKSFNLELKDYIIVFILVLHSIALFMYLYTSYNYDVMLFLICTSSSVILILINITYPKFSIRYPILYFSLTFLSIILIISCLGIYTEHLLDAILKMSGTGGSNPQGGNGSGSQGGPQGPNMPGGEPGGPKGPSGQPGGSKGPNDKSRKLFVKKDYNEDNAHIIFEKDEESGRWKGRPTTKEEFEDKWFAATNSELAEIVKKKVEENKMNQERTSKTMGINNILNDSSTPQLDSSLEKGKGKDKDSPPSES
jgi:hypothetical protein